ncbi:MAG: hypothetical protein OEM82_14235 [Acidobacteriota bacterium]|nr:hypothetical protein [Acidobacteriota bacterium]MDH3531057.1 hypothetical protein [Acidobacteriota bacterium]
MDKRDQNEVLEDFTRRLDKLAIEYMLTGSMAMAHYAKPRSTADIDIVINVQADEIESFILEFGGDYYIPLDHARESISNGRMFNILHEQSVMKIDCFPLRSDAYQRHAFGRRIRILYTNEFSVSIISKEDLILSKLQWAKATGRKCSCLTLQI